MTFSWRPPIALASRGMWLSLVYVMSREETLRVLRMVESHQWSFHCISDTFLQLLLHRNKKAGGKAPSYSSQLPRRPVCSLICTQHKGLHRNWTFFFHRSTQMLLHHLMPDNSIIQSAWSQKSNVLNTCSNSNLKSKESTSPGHSIYSSVQWPAAPENNLTINRSLFKALSLET